MISMSYIVLILFKVYWQLKREFLFDWGRAKSAALPNFSSLLESVSAHLHLSSTVQKEQSIAVDNI